MTSNLTADDRAQLSRIWGELTAAIRIVEHLLGDDDPTGLRYDRGDSEEPAVAPVPPGVDGLSVTGRPARRPTNSPAGHAFPDARAHRFAPAGVQQGGAALGDAVPPTGAGAR